MKNHFCFIKNILIYDISYRTLIGAKPLRIRFDKIDGFIRVHNGTRYLVLFGPEKYDPICNRIRSFISLKSGIAYILYTFLYVKIKVNFYDSLPLEKTLTLHTAIIHIKSVLNKDQNHYKKEITTTIIYS